jgi:gamma-glutamyltranspeptidase/glutathione hydrolase
MSSSPDSAHGHSEEVGGAMRSYAAAVPNVFPPPESMRPTLVGERYMISAGHPLVAQVAARVLEDGGTAIDAGVAAGLASNVIQADMCNLGGVAPILLRQAGDERVWSISGVGVWSREASIERFRARYGDDMPLGAACSIVPAALDSWITALGRFGTRSFREVSLPALTYAAKGFVLDRRTALAFELMGAGFKSWDSTRSIYWWQGRPPREGERLRQPDLAATLQRLMDAEHGANRREALENVHRSFYEGEVADRIAAWVRENGGWMTREDLAAFRCEVEPAPGYDYAGWRVHTGDMFCQGPVLLQALALLAGFDLRAMGHNSADYLHVLAEALKSAFSDREHFYGDPNFVATRVGDLLDEAHVRELRARIRMDHALPDLSTPSRLQPRRRDTTYFAVVDAAGNAFSCSPSDTVDGNPIVPGLGIIVSPRGVQSRLDPDHPASLKPGKRPRLTPSPGLAIGTGSRGEPRVMAFGAPGGDVIMQGMLQAFLNVVHFGMTAQQAVEAPRIASLAFPDSFYPHVHEPGRLSIEGRVAPQVQAELARRGHKVVPWPDFEFDASGVAMVVDLRPPDEAGRALAGAADPRRSGYALGR